jgi:flavoprotein
VDVSDVSKTATLLYQLFKEVVLYVGVENIVHMVTDNAANYVAAGKLLMEEFPLIFWSPCAAYCINLIL